jgi:ribosome-binding protein aMBF1 (putative translation factor)
MITIDFPNGVASFGTNDAVKRAVMDILLNSPYAFIDELAEDDEDGYYLTGKIEKHAYSKDDSPWEKRNTNEYWDNVMSTLKKTFHDVNTETDNTEKEEKEKEKMIQVEFIYNANDFGPEMEDIIEQGQVINFEDMRELNKFIHDLKKKIIEVYEEAVHSEFVPDEEAGMFVYKISKYHRIKTSLAHKYVKETKSNRLPERLSESVKHVIAAELKRVDRDHKVAIYRVLNRRGLSNLEIAEVLDVPPSTVRAYERQNQINMTCDELNDLGRLTLNKIMESIDEYKNIQKSLARDRFRGFDRG